MSSKATEEERRSGYDDDHQATWVSEGVTSSRSVLERVQHIEQHCAWSVVTNLTNSFTFISTLIYRLISRDYHFLYTC